MRPAKPSRPLVQQDFWPELASAPMVVLARLVGSRAPHRSVSEERGAAPTGCKAPPTGNTGNEKRAARNAR